MAQCRSNLRRLGPCLVLALAAHAALLTLPVRPAAAASAAAPASTLQVRWIERPAAHEAKPMPPAVVAAAAARPLIEAAPLASPVVAEQPPQTEPEQALTASASTDQTPVLPGLALQGIASDDDLYLARSLLSVAPSPLAPVVIGFPPFEGAAERYTGELTLFIDEDGTVVRVRSEDRQLPAALEDAARSAFMSVRFRPGQLAEHGAVKSRIRVEVVFENGAPRLTG